MLQQAATSHVSHALARIRAFSLDRRLAAGEDPSRSTLLAARAAQLTAPRHRRRIATALKGLLLAAEQPPRRSRVPVARGALRENETAIRELSRRVASRSPVYAPGLARLEGLLGDSAGPAYRGGPDELAAELERVEAGLSGSARREPARRGVATRRGPGLPLDPPGFVGGSFALPDGSWFHGRRES